MNERIEALKDRAFCERLGTRQCWWKRGADLRWYATADHKGPFVGPRDDPPAEVLNQEALYWRDLALTGAVQAPDEPEAVVERRMTREEAQGILKGDIQEDGGLENFGHYMAWTPGDNESCLDGKFTAEELEAISCWMRTTDSRTGGS